MTGRSGPREAHRRRRSPRTAGLALGVALVVAACSGGPAPSPTGSPGGALRSTGPGGGSTPPGASTRSIVLTASLPDDPVATWHPVASIPFGPAAAGLGYRSAAGPLLPRAFAVDGDGSLWVLDVAKRRVAHFDPRGAFLDQVELPPSYSARDLAFANGRLWVLFDGPAGGWVAPISNARVQPPTPARADGARAMLVSLVPGPSLEPGPIVVTAGEEAVPGSGFQGPAWMAVPGTGQLHPLPGVPVGDGRAIDLSMRGDAGIAVGFMGGTALAGDLRIGLRVLGAGRKIDAVASARPELALPNALATYVMLSPSQPEDQRRFGGGRYLLVVPNNGTTLRWQRLPNPGIDDAWQARHLAPGPGGELYLMVIEERGVRILRA